jgi:cell division septation protein DedD
MSIQLPFRQALRLYGLIIGLVLVCYLVGLLVGRNYFVETVEAEPAAVIEPAPDLETTPAEPTEDLKSQLDFYEDLSRPLDQKETSRILDRDEAAKPARKIEAIVVTAPRPSTAQSKGYTVQVGALSKQEEANQVLLRLQAKGFEGRIRGPQPSDVDRYFRVWVGEFPTMQEARSLEAQLKEKGFPTYVKKTD